MTLEEFNSTNWHRGNVVKLNNGKEYLVKGIKSHGRFLLLYSLEFDAKFVADYRIVDCRTSDYEEPAEVYLEKKRQKQAEAEAKHQAERAAAMKAKAERKQKNLEAQEKAHQEALARKAAKKNAQAKVEPKKEAKTVEPVESKKVESSKVVEPIPEAPKKRVRQRIKVSATKVNIDYIKRKSL